MNAISNVMTISTEDVINTLKHWYKEEAEETFKPILYFASDLTEISVDTLNDKVFED